MQLTDIESSRLIPADPRRFLDEGFGGDQGHRKAFPQVKRPEALLWAHRRRPVLCWFDLCWFDLGPSTQTRQPQGDEGDTGAYGSLGEHAKSIGFWLHQASFRGILSERTPHDMAGTESEISVDDGTQLLDGGLRPRRALGNDGVLEAILCRPTAFLRYLRQDMQQKFFCRVRIAVQIVNDLFDCHVVVIRVPGIVIGDHGHGRIGDFGLSGAFGFG